MFPQSLRILTRIPLSQQVTTKGYVTVTKFTANQIDFTVNNVDFDSTSQSFKFSVNCSTNFTSSANLAWLGNKTPIAKFHGQLSLVITFKSQADTLIVASLPNVGEVNSFVNSGLIADNIRNSLQTAFNDYLYSSNVVLNHAKNYFGSNVNRRLTTVMALLRQ